MFIMWLADLERVRGIMGLLGCASIACRWAISCALEALDWESSRLIWRLTTSVVVVVMVRGSLTSDLSLTLFPFQPSQFLVIFEISNIVGFPALVFHNFIILFYFYCFPVIFLCICNDKKYVILNLMLNKCYIQCMYQRDLKIFEGV